MTAVTENDLKRLEDLIVSSMRVIESRLTSLENGQSEIKSDIKSIDKTADLAEKVGELKNWKQIGVVVITAFISSILSGITGGVIGWLIRSAKFNP